MKKVILFVLMAIFSTVAMAQNDDKRQAAYDLVSEGVKLYDDGKYEEALKKFNAALKLDDTYASTYYEKALTLRAMDKNKEAKKTLEKSLQKCTWGNIAMNYKFLGDIVQQGQFPDSMCTIYNFVCIDICL